MSNVSLTTAIEHLDHHMLRDVGIETDGAAINERDPRYRRPARGLPARLRTMFILSGMVLLRA